MELKDFMEERVVNVTNKKSETWLEGNTKKDEGKQKKLMHACIIF